MCALPSAMGEVRSGERGARGKPEPEGIRPRSDPDRFPFPSSPASKLPQLGDIRQTWNILVFFFSSGERSNVCEDGGEPRAGFLLFFFQIHFLSPLVHAPAFPLPSAPQRIIYFHSRLLSASSVKWERSDVSTFHPLNTWHTRPVNNARQGRRARNSFYCSGG